jgi:hypothetical protein
MPEPHSSQSGSSCESDPVQHNLVLTLLDARAAHPGPGRYAWVLDRDEVVGVGFQSPLVLQAVVTAMPASVVEAFVDRLADAWPDIPGVFGPADTVSRFAGRWAEMLQVPVTPVEGQRLYALRALRRPAVSPAVPDRPATVTPTSSCRGSRGSRVTLAAPSQQAARSVAGSVPV